MSVARLVAQCKVNLFLRVLAREESGYHQLETLFCRLALGDDVTVRTGVRGRTLDCRGPAMPAGGLGPVEENLAWKAAVAFAEATGWDDGFAIEIEKRIPVGAGLGGGSADAGGVLRALNALAPRPLAPSDLVALAASIGADVPFLTQDRTPLALAWGRGDRMLALPPLPSRGCFLFVFPFRVSTREAYGWLRESPESVSPASLYDEKSFERWDDVALFAHNAFERVVVPRYEPLGETLEGLRSAGGRAMFDLALMSGSGSTVFAIMNEASTSNRELTIAPTKGNPAKGVGTITAQRVEPVVIER
jgi:4-diphosphocytidyl-2-C-methyl-D-erythritol kinase